MNPHRQLPAVRGLPLLRAHIRQRTLRRHPREHSASGQFGPRAKTVGVKRRYPGNRLVVAVEPRSNTMKLGVHNDELAASLEQADLVWMYRPEDMGDDFDSSLQPLGSKLRSFGDYDALVSDMSKRVLSGDQVVFMSNGGFGGARQTLTAVLQRTRGT